MLKRIMIGVILFAILSGCNAPTIKEPVRMYAVNTSFDEAGTALRNLNYKKKIETVGEWITEVEFIPIDQAPENMMCFSLSDWLLIVKPKLKEANRYYNDF